MEITYKLLVAAYVLGAHEALLAELDLSDLQKLRYWFQTNKKQAILDYRNHPTDYHLACSVNLALHAKLT